MTGFEREREAELEDAAAMGTLLSNARKARVERERKVVRAFLRCIGQEFLEDDLGSPGQDNPVDVEYRPALFQVKQELGGRKPGEDWQQREDRYRQAKRESDLVEPRTHDNRERKNLAPSFRRVSMGEAAQMVVECLSRKRYGDNNLDALVYVNLDGPYLEPSAPLIGADIERRLRDQGWRSVSMLFVPHAAILFARSGAPDFLLSRIGQLMTTQWPVDERLFDASPSPGLSSPIGDSTI